MRRVLSLIAVLAPVALLVGPRPVDAVELVRRPYLQGTTETSTTIVWRTDVPTAGAVRYGVDPTELDSEILSVGEQEDHSVTLRGLAPATTYYYAVHTGQALLASPAETDARSVPLHRFTTNPPIGLAHPFRAWVLGDSGTGSFRQLQVFKAMLNRVGDDRPDLFLHVGDMAYSSGTDSEFTTRFFAPYADLLSNTTVWPAMGNHEGYSSNAGEQTGPYYEAYHLPIAGEAGGLPSGTEAYYSFDYADVHFIVLDSYASDRSPEGPMLTWLEEDLAATDQEWIVAFFHHPPYTKGSHDSDRESEHIEMRENAIPILERGGVDLVMGGHSHVYERSYLLDGAYETPSTSFGIIDGGDGRILGDGPYRKTPGTANDGALYVTAGHGGTGVRLASRHPLHYISEAINGSVLLDFEPGRLTITNVRYTGDVSDTAVLVKGRSVVIGAPDGGEKYRPGARTEIRWASTQDVGRVRLEFSCDDGAGWETITESTADDGSFTWITPEVESRRARVRVSSLDDPGLNDASNARFYVGRVGPYQDLPWGSVWKYWDKPERPGVGWNLYGFNDTGWQEGAAEFGYGDGDEVTVLAGRPEHATYYFRRGFRVADDVSAVWMRVRYDDAVAIYIDGALVMRVNVDDFDHDAGASGPSTDNALIELPLPPDLFTPGEHVIAAFVKERVGSLDLTFDASLEFTFSRSSAPLCGSTGPPPDADALPAGCEDCESSLSAGSVNGGLALGLLGVRRRRRRGPSAASGSRGPAVGGPSRGVTD